MVVIIHIYHILFLYIVNNTYVYIVYQSFICFYNINNNSNNYYIISVVMFSIYQLFVLGSFLTQVECFIKFFSTVVDLGYSVYYSYELLLLVIISSYLEVSSHFWVWGDGAVAPASVMKSDVFLGYRG